MKKQKRIICRFYISKQNTNWYVGGSKKTLSTVGSHEYYFVVIINAWMFQQQEKKALCSEASHFGIVHKLLTAADTDDSHRSGFVEIEYIKAKQEFLIFNCPHLSDQILQ